MIAGEIDFRKENFNGTSQHFHHYAMQIVTSLITTCLIIPSLVLCTKLSCAEEFQVTYHLHAANLPEDAKVYLTGNLPSLGKWNPSAVKMKYVGEHIWTHQLSLSETLTIEYKYTLGSWAREGSDAAGLPLPNFVVSVEKSSEIHDHIDFFTDRKTKIIHGQITGTVKYHHKLESAGVRKRDVLVWLPPDYEKSGGHYPVLYMHDGQNIVDPNTSTFGVDWQIDESCTKLIKAGTIEPLIVVGIYNTPDRSKEYLPGPQNTAYMQFVIKTLKPLIDSNYRTKPSREYTYVGGSSAGGLCAFMLLWEHADVFSKAICMSPAFQVEETDGTVVINYVATVAKSERPAEPVFFYIDNGGIGIEKLLQPGIDEMLIALRTQGFQAKKDYHWVHATEARHSESAWAKRFPAAIEILVGTR